MPTSSANSDTFAHLPGVTTKLWVVRRLANKGMELTENSVRSFLAPAILSSSCLALDVNGEKKKLQDNHNTRGVHFVT
jgi:hypothetical protein